jgi:hypothetical protein
MERKLKTSLCSLFTQKNSFPTLYFQRGGIKHYHDGKKDKRWSVILQPTKYDFLSSSSGIFFGFGHFIWHW